MANKIRQIPNPNLNQEVTAKLLGNAIRSRRVQSNLRLEDAAALCNIAKQTLQDIELGSGNNKLDTVLQVCSGLGIKLRILPWSEDNGRLDEWQ